MIINPSYRQELIEEIKLAPAECFAEPAETTRQNILANNEALEAAAIVFQKNYEDYGCDYSWSEEEALKKLGLRNIELFKEQKTDSKHTYVSSGSYAAVITAEYVRNAEIFGSTYDEENMDDYIYDDSQWQEASNAEIFIGIFTCSKNMNEEALFELKKEAAATAVAKGLCNRLPIDAVKLIEV